MLRCNYLVAEDNAGGLFLFITDDNDITLHAYTGFEYEPGSLMNVIHDLQNDPEAYELWENDILDLHAKDAREYCRDSGINVISWRGTMRVDKMGASAVREFSLNNKIVPCDRVYVYSADVYVLCDSMKYRGDTDDLMLYRDGRVVSIMSSMEGKEIVTCKNEKTVFYRIKGGIIYENI
jgi:hypothetical protein